MFRCWYSHGWTSRGWCATICTASTWHGCCSVGCWSFNVTIVKLSTDDSWWSCHQSAGSSAGMSSMVFAHLVTLWSIAQHCDQIIEKYCTIWLLFYSLITAVCHYKLLGMGTHHSLIYDSIGLLFHLVLRWYCVGRCLRTLLFSVHLTTFLTIDFPDNRLCIIIYLPFCYVLDIMYSIVTWSRTVLSNLFDTAGHFVNFPPAGGPQSRGAMASAQSASL